MGSNAGRRGGTFEGINVYLSRNLVAPDLYDALHDALRLNGATVYTICDPDKNSSTDYHVISSANLEKFANLRAKGCNLLGPPCVFYCANEHRTFPKQGYTCCLALDCVKILTSGFDKAERVIIEEKVSAMGGVVLKEATQDADFVIVKNVSASKYQWALNVLKKPIVTKSWLDQCWQEHRVVPLEPYRILPFTGLSICVTKIPLEQRKEIQKMIEQNGGQYSADLTRTCTHLVSNGIGGDKYLVARRWQRIHIVNRRWVDQCIIKKARLDESSFPVTNNEISNSISISISSQKEKTSWTPQPSQNTATSAELPEPSVSQTESWPVPSTNTLFEAVKEGSKRGGEVAACDSRVAEDSEDNDDDLYLSECKISFVGFEEKEMKRLVGLVWRGGGTRLVRLSEKLTHIVVGSPSEAEKVEVRKLATWGVIHVVKATWLEECDKKKREIPVLPLHVASDLITSSKDSCGVNGVKSTLEDNENLSDKRKGRSESEKNIANAPGIFEFGSLCKNSTQTSNGANKARSKYTQTCTKDKDSDLFKNSNTFKNKIFCFSPSFPLDRRAEIIGWVNKGGGIIVEDPKRIKVHFIIECHGIGTTGTIPPHSTLVSSQWIRSSLQEGSMQDVRSHIIYSPLKCRIPIPGFENFRFCFSQYEERERLLLKNLCFILGAKVTDRFSRRVTHLLCKFASGPKYEASCKLNVQAVTADWISECVRMDMIVALDEYRPKNASGEEREELLRNVTQFSTQADKNMFLSQTQLTNCSKDNSEEGFCEEIESLKTSSKKMKFELSKNTSGGVADVAEAIEDLLAQSSKIQNTKLPDRPNFEINRENPESLITISRHWLNKAQKQDNTSEPVTGHVAGHKKSPSHDNFSETQTESQVVGYEEDLTGRQKIIDRVKSQSLTNELPTPV